MSQSSGPDPFEFLKMLWGPMGLPMTGMVVPTLNISEIDKRISDLKSVEHWLNMNLSLLRMSIQGLEMQRATLAAMQGTEKSATGAAPGAGSDGWWSVLQGHGGQPPDPNKGS